MLFSLVDAIGLQVSSKGRKNSQLSPYASRQRVIMKHGQANGLQVSALGSTSGEVPWTVMYVRVRAGYRNVRCEPYLAKE